jgi:hypothetical protein
MMDAAEEFYVDGKLQYLSDPSTSILKVLTQDEFDTLSDKEVQNILHHQHIIVVRGKVPKYGFDPEGLETLAPLDKPIVIHGEHHFASEFAPPDLISFYF